MTSTTDTTATTGSTGTSRPDRPSLSTAGLFTVLLGAALPIVDFFVVNVALPTIDADLRAGPAMLELVVAGYGIAYATLLVLGGRLGDQFGRRRLFGVGLTLFTLTSLACGIAPNAGTLVAARAAQGAAAALMLPQVLSTITATTSGERRARAFGAYGAVGGIGTVVGQLLGGLLVAADLGGTSWRPIFLINVPIGLLGLLLARRTVPDTRAADPVRPDPAGTVLLGATMLALLVPLMTGRTLHWPLWTVGLLVAAPVFAALLVRNQRGQERRGLLPLLAPSVIRLRSVRTGLVAAVPFFAGFGGFMFVYAVTLQSGLRFGPVAAGLALTPMAVAFLTASLLAPRLVRRYGRRVVTVGAVVQIAGLLALIGTAALAWPNLGVVTLAPAMVVFGAGQGSVMTTLFRVILAEVPADLAGVGSGVMVTTQQTALALGVATLGSLFLALAAPGVLGVRDAFLVALAVHAAISCVLAVVSRWLPDPR